MTIQPGKEWGTAIERPDGARRASSDAELVAALTDDPDAAVVLTGGDLWRTLGRPGEHTPGRRYPIDLAEVRLDGGAPVLAVGHVVARLPRAAGGWLRGPVVVVMNAEFLGDWDVAPRGHPNDGRLEAFELDGSTGMRQRLAIGRRLPTATHLPHPAIGVRSVRECSFDFARPLEVWVDGVRHGRATCLSVTARPDAATVIA